MFKVNQLSYLNCYRRYIRARTKSTSSLAAVGHSKTVSEVQLLAWPYVRGNSNHTVWSLGCCSTSCEERVGDRKLVPLVTSGQSRGAFRNSVQQTYHALIGRRARSLAVLTGIVPASRSSCTEESGVSA